MLESLKHIFSNIPKFIRSIILAGFISPIIGYVIVQITTDNPINISLSNIGYLLIIIVSFTVIGFIIGSIISITQLRYNRLAPKCSIKKLSDDKVAIGEYITEGLSVGILAEIVLDENSKPSIDSFLIRIKIGEPYCLSCSNPFELLRASWQLEGIQIGYKCTNCDYEIHKDYNDLQREVKGKVRKNFDEYWNIYIEEIDKMTGGKRSQYKLPY